MLTITWLPAKYFVARCNSEVGRKVTEVEVIWDTVARGKTFGYGRVVNYLLMKVSEVMKV